MGRIGGEFGDYLQRSLSRFIGKTNHFKIGGNVVEILLVIQYIGE